MDLAKLRIMQQIQIALVEKGLIASINSSGNSSYSHISVQEAAKADLVESLFDFEVTEDELQLWHDTIVYGPQVAKGNRNES
ncbi:hypothetical protein [Vibrio phage LP.1]|nr:hypothetical protein [Vibrio phage LP.1]